MNITTKTVSVNAEHSKSDNGDNDNVAVLQGLDGKENQDCTCRHEFNYQLTSRRILLSFATCTCSAQFYNVRNNNYID